MSDRLTPSAVQLRLKTAAVARHLIILERVDSTNAFALGLVEPPHGLVVVAEDQTRGRGRFGRHWIAPPGKGLLFSVVIRPDTDEDLPSAVTLLASLAVAKAIRQVTGLTALIKWPNDVLVQGRKVCGILTEARSQRGRVQYLVTGIGVNVNQSRRDLFRDLARTAVSLRIAGGKS